MAIPAKLSQILALLGKKQVDYETAIAVAAATDGIQLQFQDRNYPVLVPEFAYQGDLGPATGNLGTIKRAAQSGKSFRYDAPTRCKPGGAAYSASVKSSLHLLLEIAGYDMVLDATPSAEKWTGTPTAPGTGFAAMSAELYARGEKFPAKSVISDWAYDFPDAGPPAHTFSLRGIFNGDVADAATPAPTYPLLAVDAPLATGILFTLGNLSANAEVKSGSFRLNREVDNPRVNLTASGGHRGFIPQGRAPELRAVLESTALVGSPYTSASAFDPYKLLETGQNFAASLQFGSTQYFRWKHNFPQVQLIGIAPQVVNGVACMELTMRPYCSSPIANDDNNVVFD